MLNFAKILAILPVPLSAAEVVIVLTLEATGLSKNHGLKILI